MSTGKKKSKTMALEMSVDGLTTPIAVRKSSRARRLTLRVSQTEKAVIVTIPKYCGLDEANEFVSQHLNWIRDRLSTLPDPVPFLHGALVPLRGEPYELQFVSDEEAARFATGSPIVSVMSEQQGPTSQTMDASLGPLNCGPDALEQKNIIRVRGRSEHAPRRFRDWLYQEAKQDLSQQVAFHARRLHLRAKRISIKDQSTRWGSCSSTGTLSFSWRLILAPFHVLDYVAAHEVAHLAEMNHGPNFWRLVKQTCPDMDRSREWLRQSGSELHRYG